MIKWMQFLALIVIIFSCKKEEVDKQSPLISILHPIENQSFNIYDTIQIKGLVTDDKNVKSISISLQNSNNINVLNSISITPNTTSYQLNEQFLLNDLYLPSGWYHVKISAFDDINQTDEYISVMINAVPKTRNGFFVFSTNGTTTTITKLDNALNASYFTAIPSDFKGGIVNSLNQQVLSCGNVTGNLVSFDATTASQDWIINNNASGFQYFTAISQNENTVYVGFYNKDIIGYNKNGNQIFATQSIVNSYASFLFVHENNLLLTEQKEISTGTTRIVSYYLTGFMKDNIVLNEDVVSSFSFSPNELVLFTNLGGNGKINVYNTSSSSIWQPFSLGIGTISSATEISKGVYLIAQNGNVVKVDLNSFSYLTYLVGVNPDIIKYDNVTNEIIVTSGNSLTIYDYATKSVKGNYTHSDTIREIGLWYNK